jgi:hypothetical protein
MPKKAGIAPKWDKEGYRFAFFNFRKTPDGIVKLRQELQSMNDPELKFQKLREIAQYRLDNPPKYTPRAKPVHELYQRLTRLSTENLETGQAMRLEA